MRILHAITGLQAAAGTTTFCKRMAEEQAMLGHEVEILTPNTNVIANEVKQSPLNPHKRIPDVVHIHAIWTPWLHKMHRWAHKIGAKVVLSPHGMLSPWAMAHKRWKKILPWYLYQKGDVVKADLIHTTAPLETQWVRDLGFSNPIVEVPLGVDLPKDGLLRDCVARNDEHTPTRHREDRRTSLRGASATKQSNEAIHTLLFVGRIYPVKGLDLLIRAWDSVDTTGWELRLVGPDQAGYMQVLKGICKSANVEFSGPLYGEDLQKAYASSRALVLPSYTENFGAIVLDELSYGLPVLTSENTPWNFLQEKGCGWHFPTRVDALAETLKTLFATSEETLNEMGSKGRKLVEENYAWPALTRKMVAGYEVLGECLKSSQA